MPCLLDDDLDPADLRGVRARSRPTFGPGPQLIVGPNAAGKTTLLEAIVLLAWGRSHRTSTDGELVRWGTELARVEGRAGPRAVEVALVRPGRVGPPRRPGPQADPGQRRRRAGRPALVGLLRTVVFAPEEMLLVVGSPGLRRAALDQLAAQRSAAYLPRPRRLHPDPPAAEQPAPGDPRGAGRARRAAVLGRGRSSTPAAAIVGRAAAAPGGPGRRRWPRPTRRSRPRRPAPAALAIGYATNAPALPGESPRDALARRLGETAEKEVWNGSTLVGPHRDDLVFELDGRDLAGFASRGQQRTAILAFKLAELDLLTAQDGRPPLLLLDDVFSRARPRAPGPPRPADRRAAPGVRDDDDARRPRPGARRGRDALGGRAPDGGGAAPGSRPRRSPARPRTGRAGAGRWRGSATCCPMPPAASGSRTSSAWRGRWRRSRRSSPSASRPRPARAA